MTEPGFAVEVQLTPRERVRVTRDRRGRIEIRIHSLLSVSSGVYAPTKDGLTVTVEKAGELAAALKAMGRAQ